MEHTPDDVKSSLHEKVGRHTDTHTLRPVDASVSVQGAHGDNVRGYSDTNQRSGASQSNYAQFGYRDELPSTGNYEGHGAGRQSVDGNTDVHLLAHTQGYGNDHNKF